VPELDRLGLLTVVDRAALATYCQAWARYVEAEAMLAQYGSVLKAKGSDYIQVSPYATISRHNAQLVKSFSMEFGLTPSSRSRISVTPPTVADPFEDYLHGRGNAN
jgi:P27 family predicted phage terminase small subunit